MAEPFDRDRLLASPLLDSLAAPLRLCPPGRFPDLAELNAMTTPAMQSGGGVPIRFAPPQLRTRELASQYEVRVYRDGAIPTRENEWHDLFNALVWLRFPRTKAALNRRHFEELTAQPSAAKNAARGPVRDCLTLFDEGGVIVACADPHLARMLQGFRWKELFWESRDQVCRAMRFFVFGHSIHEKALEPYVGLTAKAVLVPVAATLLDAPGDALLPVLDEAAAQWLLQSDNLHTTLDLMPLPIMGVPGWHGGNEHAAFYDDARVFRPGRRRAA
ncbi:MAG: DUF3025 domain-containing protein [Betaproteobacteria bacterium]|nr:DUF3025 domain-containing protein [Betaproteobacteria bacterium]